ncbi:universal stress protein [Ferrovibrio sp.]|uniref:universal stress protein n=1 Tax=Ferrovibrio sp. TaxID=1917215 RepID=UPI000CB99B62|nr:universal stress protein [Ferrovibrio sp.]PJI39542.1 MAG: universal stress family protein [Ferrovibrio sp.]
MRYCDILLHLTADKRSREKAATALALAKRFDARLQAIYTLPFPSQLYYMSEYVPPSVIDQQIEEAREEAEKVRNQFEQDARSAGVAADWAVTEQSPIAALRQLGTTCDIVVVGQSDPDRDRTVNAGLDALPADLALALGRPVLVVPYIGHYPQAGSTVMVAWNGSREAARAVHDALPLLKTAKSVIILCIDPDAAQTESAKALARHLAHSGIVAKVRHTTAGDMAVGDVLLSALADGNADLLVMGAYGHSRLRETVFGGVTATLLDSMTVPVLLSN